MYEEYTSTSAAKCLCTRSLERTTNIHDCATHQTVQVLAKSCFQAIEGFILSSLTETLLQGVYEKYTSTNCISAQIKAGAQPHHHVLCTPYPMWKEKPPNLVPSLYLHYRGTRLTQPENEKGLSYTWGWWWVDDLRNLVCQRCVCVCMYVCMCVCGCNCNALLSVQQTTTNTNQHTYTHVHVNNEAMTSLSIQNSLAIKPSSGVYMELVSTATNKHMPLSIHVQWAVTHPLTLHISTNNKW